MFNKRKGARKNRKIRAVLADKQDDAQEVDAKKKSDEELSRDVKELKENFNTIKYTFEECPAYDFPEVIS
jgi:hypothetical protein